MNSIATESLTSAQENQSSSGILGAARNLTRTLVATPADSGATIARIALGLAMLPHGAQKLLGWYGGYGFENTMNYFTQSMHIPWIFALAAILAESLGAVALVAGFASRLAAAAIGAVMAVAVITSHAQHGFFMNWSGKQAGEGFEYHILAIALSLVVIVAGGGRASVDRMIQKHL